MFPQTHIHFARQVLGRLNTALILGSIFPDMAIGAGIKREVSHYCGRQLLEHMQETPVADFARGVITHGVEPFGLDYYGDEKNPPQERGYCFEKGRDFIASTIEACNIPPEMGWWKSHNIIEMGVELRISRLESYGRLLLEAFQDEPMVQQVCQQAGDFFGLGADPFLKRIHAFARYIDTSRATSHSLAERYDFQMYYKHKIRVNIPRVARLIEAAAEAVAPDIEQFLKETEDKVRQELIALQALDDGR